MIELIPKPVLLNCWKHHLQFIAGKINEQVNSNKLFKLNEALLKIGNSTLDLYCGNISPGEVAKFSLHFLNKSGYYSFENYKKWITESKQGYRSASLPDRSVWIFRIGDDPERYIHIHPGRNVPNTIRVKATVLKIAICAISESKISECDPSSIECINRVRKKYLDLAPSKNIRTGSALSKIITLIKSY